MASVFSPAGYSTHPRHSPSFPDFFSALFYPAADYCGSSPSHSVRQAFTYSKLIPLSKKGNISHV